MADSEIPSGMGTRESQADGTAVETGKETGPGQVFRARASWKGDGAGTGAICGMLGAAVAMTAGY